MRAAVKRKLFGANFVALHVRRLQRLSWNFAGLDVYGPSNLRNSAGGANRTPRFLRESWKTPPVMVDGNPAAFCWERHSQFVEIHFEEPVVDVRTFDAHIRANLSEAEPIEASKPHAPLGGIHDHIRCIARDCSLGAAAPMLRA